MSHKEEMPENLGEGYPSQQIAEEGTSIASHKEFNFQNVRDILKERMGSILDEKGLIGGRKQGSEWVLLIGGAAIISASAFIVYRNREGIASFIRARMPHSEEPKLPSS